MLVRRVLFIVLVLISSFIIVHFGIFQLYSRRNVPKTLSIISKGSSVQIDGSVIECDPDLWRSIDYKRLPIPETALRDAVSISVESHTNFVNRESLHYKVTKPLTPHFSGVSVLLLHGAAFSSSTWEELGTMNLVSAFGFPVFAVDLPGFGKSKARSIPQKSVFLSDVIRVLKLKNPVIVSPSMSGVYSLPYVIEHWKDVSGYVPISPSVSTAYLKNVCHGAKNSNKDVALDATCERLIKYDVYGKHIDLSCVKVPVMIVHGEHDRSENSALMCHFPWSKGVEIPNGQHAAYLSDPPLWHKLLYNFLYVVNKTHSCR